MKSYFILPVHNKEDLLDRVLDGIVNSCQDDFHIVSLVDGCTDNSEHVINDFISNYKLEKKFTILKMPDVHEITCLNFGLTKIRLMNPGPDDLVFTVQDDVVLQELNIDKKFHTLFSNETNLGYVSMRLGCDLLYIANEGMIGERNLIESEFGHWKPLGWTHYTIVNHGDFVKTQVAIRSPTCVQWKRYQEVGFYDSALAPCGWDCHEFSIRMLQHNYQNGVFAMKYQSDLAWGAMRKQQQSEVNAVHQTIYNQNRKYIGRKYKHLFRQ